MLVTGENQQANLTNLEDKINKLTDLLCLNKIQDMLQNTVLVIEEVQQLIKLFNENDIDSLNQIIQYVAIAMENKDYLLISDIMTYELLPLINKLNVGRRTNVNL